MNATTRFPLFDSLEADPNFRQRYTYGDAIILTVERLYLP